MFVTEPKEIWIIGNFWVTQAAQVAKKSTYDKNLGLLDDQFTVRWMEKSFMLWRDLVPDLERAATILGDPSIVFIHLGSGDLADKKFMVFTSGVKRDLGHLTKSYPNTTFIWSAVIPKKEWLNTYMERKRNKFNVQVSKFANKIGIHVASFNEVIELSKELYQQTENGGKQDLHNICNVFIRNLKDSLEVTMDKKKIKVEHV